MHNPFSTTFGMEPNNFIQRLEESKQIISEFNDVNPSNYVYLITGVRGIGKTVFYQACEEARRLGADKLCISAHSSKESQAAYKALGCVHAKEINPKLAEEEPCDVQLEYVLD